MKREEFIKEVEELGFYVSEWTEIINKFNRTLGTIREDCICRLDTDYNEHYTLKDDEKIKLFELMTEYAKTPIKER